MAAIPNSILDDTKKLLGVHADDPSFDTDITLHINSVLSLLHQLGASPLESVSISDSTATWQMLLDNINGVNFMKSYVYLKVKSWFDPPVNANTMTALTEQIKELEWRLSIMEIKFNPYAYSGLDLGNVYIIDDLGDFPPEAPVGALGFDPDSGKIWRNT